MARINLDHQPLNPKTLFRILILAGAIFGTFLLPGTNRADEKKCLFIAAYHQGYEWHDAIENALTSKLKGHCKLEKFYMDVKRNPNPDYAKKKGLEAKELITSYAPDVVITSDDDPVREVLVPFFKDSSIPFVFAAVKNSMEPFGLPFKNTTGIVAIISLNSIISEIMKDLKNLKTITSLSDYAESSIRASKYYQRDFSKFGFEYKTVYAKTFEDWKKLFLEAQASSDAIVIGAFASIKDFEKSEAKAFIEKNAKKLILATAVVARPLSMLAMVRYPEEMGEWAGEAAIKILNGATPSSISVTTNKRFDYYVNESLLNKAGILLNDKFIKKAINYK